MTQTMRMKATNAQKKACGKAMEKHYQVMARAASEVVLRHRGRQYRNGAISYVLFVFPHWVKFAKSFPKGVIVSKTFTHDTRKINATKLLDWLYENGKCSYNAQMLTAQTTRFDVFVKELEKHWDRV